MKISLFSDESARLLALLIMALVFFAGAVGGCLTAVYAIPGDTVLAHMNAYLAQITEAIRIDWRTAAVDVFLYPGMVFLLGYTRPGVVCIPVVVAAKGFFFSFSVAVFVRMYGTSGILLALGSLGVPNLVTLPCLFFLAAFGFDSARHLLTASGGAGKQPGGLLGMHYFTRFAICAAFLLPAAAYGALLSGRVVRFIAPMVL